MFAHRNQHKLSLGSRGYGYAITLLSLRDISPKRGIFADPYNLQINIFFANFADGLRMDKETLPQAHTSCVPAPSVRERKEVC